MLIHRCLFQRFCKFKSPNIGATKIKVCCWMLESSGVRTTDSEVLQVILKWYITGLNTGPLNWLRIVPI